MEKAPIPDISIQRVGHPEDIANAVIFFHIRTGQLDNRAIAFCSWQSPDGFRLIVEIGNKKILMHVLDYEN